MTLDAFLAAYATGFTQGDSDQIAQLFHYPVHVVGTTADADPQVRCADQEQWRQVLQRVLAAYRRLEVATAEVDELSAFHIGRGADVAMVRWALRRADGSTVYQFDANYTIVTSGPGLRISAIAHNEADRLQAARGLL